MGADFCASPFKARRRLSACLCACAVLVLLATGCASAPQRVEMRKLFKPNPQESTYAFKDVRSRVVANLQNDSWGTAKQYDDDSFDIPPPQLVNSTLRELNELLQNKTVSLKRFDCIYLTTTVREGLMTSANAAMYGALGGLVSQMLEATQSPNRCDATIEVEIDGQEFVGYASSQVSKYSTRDCVNQVVADALGSLQSDIRVALTPAR